jgi:hypothetical protein
MEFVQGHLARLDRGAGLDSLRLPDGSQGAEPVGLEVQEIFLPALAQAGALDDEDSFATAKLVEGGR